MSLGALATEIIGVALSLCGVWALAASVYDLGQRHDLIALYLLFVGGLLLKAGSGMLGMGDHK